MLVNIIKHLLCESIYIRYGSELRNKRSTISRDRMGDTAWGSIQLREILSSSHQLTGNSRCAIDGTPAEAIDGTPAKEIKELRAVTPKPEL